MPALFSNNAAATLAGAIDAWHTGLTLAAGQGALFPSPDAAKGEHFSATLADAAGNLEVVTVTARSGDALTVGRGQQGTVPRAFAAGDRLELRLTAAELSGFVQRAEVSADTASQLKNVWHVAAAAAILDHGDPAIRGSLAWVLAQAGAAPAEVRLPGGAAYAVGRSLAVPENISLAVDRGAVLNVAAGATLTIDGELLAGSQAVFAGLGSVTGRMGGRPVLPQWWGARGDGATDDTAALEKALAFPAVGLPAGTYLLSRPLTMAAHGALLGEGAAVGYIDWAQDFEKAQPAYAGRAAVLQYKAGIHGTLLSAVNHARFENVVFRCGQPRTALDRFMDGAPSHLSFQCCRFENLDAVMGSGAAYGEHHVEDCRFYGCGTCFSGGLVDSRFLACVFTTCTYAFDLGAGSGFNLIQNCRLEWGKVGFRCFEGRSNTLMGNVLDAHEEAAVCLNRAKSHVLSGNIFWRNGRNGAEAEKRSHLVLREAAEDNLVVGNTFLKGGPDGGQDQWPRFIVEAISVVSARNVFRDNQTLGGCMEMPFNDAYWTSSEAFHMDDVHVKGIGNPGQSNDQLIEILKRIALLAAGPVNVHLYENRNFTVYTDLAPGKLRLVGHGGVTLTDTTGRSHQLLGLENLTYGRAFGQGIATMSAGGPPTAGWWERGAMVWNASPSSGQPIGWACTAAGAPGTWAGFGTVA